MSEGADSGHGQSVGRQLLPLKRWLESFALELYHTNLLFWLRGQSTAGKNILLSTFASALIFTARRTHADYSNISGAPKIIVAVIAGSFIISLLVCLFDPKLRPEQNVYLSNSVRCHQLITVGVLISASIISLNIFWRWSEKISYTFNFDGFDEIAWAFAAPAALFSFLVILTLSVLRDEFRVAARSAPIRTFIWSTIILVAIFLVDLAMFGFGKQI